MIVDGTTLHLHRLWNWHPAGAVTLWNHVWIKDHHRGTPEGETILRHEAQHVRDQAQFHVLYWLSYCGLILGFLSLRGFWEWRAYKVTLRSWHERRLLVPYNLELVAKWLSGPLYLWAMPRWLARRLVSAEVNRLTAQ